MKTIILIAIASMFCIASCQKTGVSPSGVFGKWELRRMYGGFAYRDSAYKPGNGTLYQFNGDSTYKYFIKGQLSSHGVFHIKKNGIRWSDNVAYDALLLDNDTYGDIITFKGSTLTIGTTVTDGIARDYVRIE